MFIEMTYEDWINREFRLLHDSLIDDWIREKTFGTERDLRVSQDMKHTVQEHWKMEIEQIQNPFLQIALGNALCEIDWFELARDYFDALETC